ncbi:hypothetical protein Btru_006732 [Bulinus truncatus]|nr:hypothetical protein Btru_006732 [Bulinus truncatus]
MELMNYSDFQNYLSNTTRECMQQYNASSTLRTVVDIEKYVVPTLIWFGIVTNILTLLTLRSPKLKESPYVYLSALAVADLSALALMFTDLLFREFDLILIRIRVNYPLTNLAATVAVNVIMVMTIERCVFVQFPLRAPVKCTVSRARIHVTIIVLVSCVINSPRFFWYELKWCFMSTLDRKVIDGHRVPGHAHGVCYYLDSQRRPQLHPFLRHDPDEPVPHLQGPASAQETVQPGSPAQDAARLLVTNFILYAFINTKFFAAFRLMLKGWKIFCVYHVTGKRHQRRFPKPHAILKKDSSLAISIQRDTSLSGLSA